MKGGDGLARALPGEVPHPFAFFAKGWEAQTWFSYFRIQSLNIRDRCSHPAKNARMGHPAPSISQHNLSEICHYR
jgi:hypothetical protein